MAPFQYTYTPNPKISNIFNSLKPANATPFTPVTRSLPNGAGSYQSPVVAQPTAPVATKPVAPIFTPPTVPVAPAAAPAAPAPLAAIEKAYAGIYDPALKDVFSKLDLKQKQDAADLANKTKLSDAAIAQKNAIELKQTPTYADLHPAGAAGLNGLSLDNFVTTSSKGNQYVDLSTLTDKAQKAVVENAARASGVPVLTDANVQKMNAIEDTRNNLDNIKAQFDKIGYSNGTTKALGGFGLSNRVQDLFGNTDIGSFKAWRTAAINSIQALAGGVGSGLRINQAEINAAMQNDIPNEGDTVAVGEAKLNVLKSQLDSWENTLLNQNSPSSSVNKGTNQSSGSAPITAPDGAQVIITD